MSHKTELYRLSYFFLCTLRQISLWTCTGTTNILILILTCNWFNSTQNNKPHTETMHNNWTVRQATQQPHTNRNSNESEVSRDTHTASQPNSPACFPHWACGIRTAPMQRQRRAAERTAPAVTHPWLLLHTDKSTGVGGWVSGGGRLFTPALALSGGCPLCHNQSAPCCLWPELRGVKGKCLLC